MTKGNKIFVDGGKLARNSRKTAIWAGGWGRLPIKDDPLISFLICSLVSRDNFFYILIACFVDAGQIF